MQATGFKIICLAREGRCLNGTNINKTESQRVALDSLRDHILWPMGHTFALPARASYRVEDPQIRPMRSYGNPSAAIQFC